MKVVNSVTNGNGTDLECFVLNAAAACRLMDVANSGAMYDGTLLSPGPPPSILSTRMAKISSRLNLKHVKINLI